MACICIVLLYVEFQSLVDGPGMSLVGAIRCPQTSQTCCDNCNEDLQSSDEEREEAITKLTSFKQIKNIKTHNLISTNWPKKELFLFVSSYVACGKAKVNFRQTRIQYDIVNHTCKLIWLPNMLNKTEMSFPYD